MYHKDWEKDMQQKEMSNWAKLHLKVVQLLGGSCSECGLKVDELKSPSLMHVHHENHDGNVM